MKVLPYTLGSHTLRIILIRTLYSFLFAKEASKEQLKFLVLGSKAGKVTAEEVDILIKEQPRNKKTLKGADVTCAIYETVLFLFVMSNKTRSL